MTSQKGVMDKYILPVLTHGSQKLEPTKKELSKLRICQRKMEHKLLNITRRDWIRNEDIRKIQNIKEFSITNTSSSSIFCGFRGFWKLLWTKQIQLHTIGRPPQPVVSRIQEHRPKTSQKKKILFTKPFFFLAPL